MRRKKYNHEQLSRILSAHEGGQLARGGSNWRNTFHLYSACVVQAAKLIENNSAINNSLSRAFDLEYPVPGYGVYPGLGAYDVRWTSDELLRWLESKGVA